MGSQRGQNYKYEVFKNLMLQIERNIYNKILNDLPQKYFCEIESVKKMIIMRQICRFLILYFDPYGGPYL